MNKKHFVSRLLVSALPLLALAGRAQSDAPMSGPPPATSSSSSETARTSGNGVSLTDATNSTGKTSGNGTVKELRFAAVDADSDGMISVSEFVTFMDAGNVPRSAGVNPAETLFRQIDRNHDNFLSEDEVTSYQDEQDRARK